LVNSVVDKKRIIGKNGGPRRRRGTSFFLIAACTPARNWNFNLSHKYVTSPFYLFYPHLFGRIIYSCIFSLIVWRIIVKRLNETYKYL
jgi:hypothetical protein